MHHAAAREAISAILTADGFGERAVALALSAEIEHLPGADDAWRQRALDRSRAMKPDRSVGYSGPLADEAPADNADALVTQLAKAVVAHPVQAGLQIACLDSLRTLWPHVGGNERLGMRQRFLAGCAGRSGPAGSSVSVADLHRWQRDLPTGLCDLPPSIASLKGLLGENDPRRAYLVVAEHLGCDMDPATLFWVLGALACQVQLQYIDHEGWLAQILMGSMAGQGLVSTGRLEFMATLVSQLAHQLWWCRQKAGMQPLRVCLDASVAPLVEAIRSGDCSAAQRSARIHATRPEQFWKHILLALGDATGFGDRGWFRSLAISVTVARRSGTLVPPDDAAALASVLTDLVWQRQQKPATVPG